MAHTFHTKLRTFLNDIFCPRPKKYGPKKLELYIKMPYFNDDTNTYFKTKVNEIFSKYYPQIKPIIIFHNQFKISSFINHKEKLQKTFDSMVVYLFTCSRCQLGYIGSTKKCIFSRFQEHRGISSRTGRPLSRPLQSSIRDHCDTICKCTFSLEDFTILYRGQFENEIRIAESILIKNRNPELNLETSSFPLKIV